MIKRHLVGMFFCVVSLSSVSVSAQELSAINDPTMKTLMRGIVRDYRRIAQNVSDGRLNLTVDPSQSFKLTKAGLADRYLLAVVFEPKNSQIEGLQSQCEIIDYSADRKFLSKILSVGLSDYGICESFDAIGVVKNKKHIVIGIGVIVRMAYGPSAVEQKTPFFLRFDRTSSNFILDDKISKQLQNTVGLNSLYKISRALR